MRITKNRDTTEARTSKVALAFRELLSTRMLWVTGGIAIIGIMAGLVFYTGQSRLRLQNQAEPNGQIATVQSQPTDIVPEALAEQEAIAQSSPSQVPSSKPCDTTKQQQAVAKRDNAIQAEEGRHQQLMDKRRGVKRLLSSITGDLVSPPSPEELKKHESSIAQIHQIYDQARAAANCS